MPWAWFWFSCFLYCSFKLQGLLRLVDVPGHERLRMKFFDQFKETTRALIFVIDAMTFQKDLRDVAEYVYDLFMPESLDT